MEYVNVEFNGLDRHAIKANDGKVYFKDSYGNYYRLNTALSIWHKHDGRKIPKEIRKYL